jgi:hypothetical protein
VLCSVSAKVAAPCWSRRLDGRLFDIHLPWFCDQPRIQPRRLGGERLAAERKRPARSARRSEHRGARAAGSRPSDHPIRYHCACVDTAHAKTVPGSPEKIRAVRYTPGIRTARACPHDLGWRCERKSAQTRRRTKALAIPRRGRQRSMSGFSPQPGGTGPVFSISASLVASADRLQRAPRSLTWEKLAPVAAIPDRVDRP